MWVFRDRFSSINEIQFDLLTSQLTGFITIMLSFYKLKTAMVCMTFSLLDEMENRRICVPVDGWIAGDNHRPFCRKKFKGP